MSSEDFLKHFQEVFSGNPENVTDPDRNKCNQQTPQHTDLEDPDLDCEITQEEVKSVIYR